MNRPATIAKKPAKKAAKLAPFVFTGHPVQIHVRALEDLVNVTYTARQIHELLRERGLPIPAQKPEAVNRLVDWLRRDGASFTLTLR